MVVKRAVSASEVRGRSAGGRAARVPCGVGTGLCCLDRALRDEALIPAGAGTVSVGC